MRFHSGGKKQVAVCLFCSFIRLWPTPGTGQLGFGGLLSQFGFDWNWASSFYLGAFFLFIAVGGISFLTSSLSYDEKLSLGISGAIAFGFFSLALSGKSGEKLTGCGAPLSIRFMPHLILSATRLKCFNRAHSCS